jgi:hypothetical protein
MKWERPRQKRWTLSGKLENLLKTQKLGGLGIRNIDKFSRALRLRWMWYNWDSHEKHLKKLLKVQDATTQRIILLLNL